MTIKDLISAWWADYRPTIAITTAHHREMTIRTHIIPEIGHIDAKRLRQTDISYLSNKTPHTQLATYKILNSLLRWAAEHKYVKHNIMDDVPRPKYKPGEIDVYKLDDLEVLLTYLEGRWLWLPVYIASRTGLRRGEVCGLQWGDIDLDRGFLTVRRTISAVSSHDVYVRPPKTKQSRRRVDLDPELIAVLCHRKKGAKSIWVCEAPKRADGMPNPWNITQQLHDACIAAGIPHHTFHALRHTHATLLMAENVHPKVVSERLGHSNTQITEDIYSHTLPTLQSSAVAATSKIFSYHPG